MEYKINPNQVYMTPDKKHIFTIKKIVGHKVTIGGLCYYYMDSITSLVWYQTSLKFIKKCKKVKKGDFPQVKNKRVDAWQLKYNSYQGYPRKVSYAFYYPGPIAQAGIKYKIEKYPVYDFDDMLPCDIDESIVENGK
jgi:hypothetical protein